MVESFKPTKAAVVAAPMRKLCPENPVVSIPAAVNALQMAENSLSRVRKEPSLNTKNGPLTAGRTATYARIAVTGHKSDHVLPKKMETPCERGQSYSALAALAQRWGFGGCPQQCLPDTKRLLG